jgi:hypothetical protein
MDGELRPYMMNPIINKDDAFTTKVIIASNHELKDYKTNPRFRNYIGEEGIMVEPNMLNTVQPENVGFLENLLPRYETLELHRARLMELLPSTCPNFQVTLIRSGGKKTNWVQLVAVQSEAGDVETLSRLLLDVSAEGHINFFPWTNYTTMTTGKKITLISEIKKWNSAFRCLTLDGFDEDNNVIPMQWRDDDELDTNPKNFCEKTSVTQYLQHHVKSAKGDNLFEFVYPQINGVREFLVYWENFGDAKSYMSNARGELAKHMNVRSINAIFLNPTEAYQQSKVPAWKPFERASKIIETVVPKNNYRNNNKRIRTSGGKEEYTPKTSTETEGPKGWDRAGGGIPTNTVVSPIIVDPVYNGGTKANDIGMNTTVNMAELQTSRSYTNVTIKDNAAVNNKYENTSKTDEVNILKKKLLELETTVQNMEAKIDNIPKVSVELLQEQMQSISTESHKVLKNIITTELKNEIKTQNDGNLINMLESMKIMMAEQTASLRVDLSANHNEMKDQVKKDLEEIRKESTAQNDEIYDMVSMKLITTKKELSKRLENVEPGGVTTPIRTPLTRSKAKQLLEHDVIMDTIEDASNMELEKELTGDYTDGANKKNE